jgi:2-oxoglutarate dehydrogenase E2 component (dihydrolipoamide succinyltransferase)
MATLEIKVPTVGESISEVVIGDWLKPEGVSVAVDEPLVSLETDKVNVEVPSPGAGVIASVLKRKGETARVGEVIGTVDTEAAATAVAGTSAASTAAASTAAASTAAPAKSKQPELKATVSEPARVMPAAARVLGEAGVPASEATATGPGGRITKEDAQKAVQAKGRLAQGQAIPLVYAEPPVQPLATGATPAAQPSGQPAKPQALPLLGREEVVAMSPLRKRVAQRLVEAQQTAAILTTFNEVDMSAVMELRKRHQDEFTAKHGVKLGFMSFFVKATVEALRAWPSVNAQIRGDQIVYQHFHDIGVAVGGGKGLVVPVLRNCEQLSFAEIEKQLADLGARAKANTLKLEELQGGTFSISNGGIYGSMMSTPILNPPQSGILGMHAIQERAVVVGGQIVVRPMMYLALSYDHRLIDGREAVSFLVHLKKAIEAPERLLLSL